MIASLVSRRAGDDEMNRRLTQSTGCRDFTASGRLSSMMYWVGTSDVNVIRCSDRVRRTSPGSKLFRSWTKHVAPQYANANDTYSEFAWHIGITSRQVSASVKPMSKSVTSEIIALPAWVRTAPFAL